MQVKTTQLNLDRRKVYDYLLIDPSSPVLQISDAVKLPERFIKTTLEYFRYHNVIRTEKAHKIIRATNGKFAGSSREVIDSFDLI